MKPQIDQFKVTRIHGMNALWSLSDAYTLWTERNALGKLSKNESPEEKWQTADSTGARLCAVEEAMFSHLTQTIVLYQASMEAILSNAVSQNKSVRAAVKNGGFKKQWLAALEAVNQPTNEFRAYENDFYQEMRIPLTHLHPKSDERLIKINSIDFPQVYSGVRYGWWAHIRLLIGIGLGSPDIESNWEHVCSGVKLPSELFPELYPSRRVEE